MAWNDEPTVRDLDKYGRKHGFKRIVLVGLNQEKGVFEVVTWGKNKKRCDNARKIGEEIYQKIKSGEILVDFQS